MDVIFRLLDLEFEWDDDKAYSNIEKHRVTFEEAAEVFFDPLSVVEDASVNQEQRDRIVGFSFSRRLSLVVYTERQTRTRISSARPATRQERIQHAEDRY